MMPPIKDSDEEIFKIASRFGRRLLRHAQTVTTAESCTGGWIAKALTDVPGSSRWFGEGFVTYSNEAKVRRLGVPRSILRTQGAVSEAVVRAMARGAIKGAGASHSIAVTGIAGPDGGVAGKPVGTVWFCWGAMHGRRLHLEVERKHFRGDREAVRRKTVRWALAHLLRR